MNLQAQSTVPKGGSGALTFYPCLFYPSDNVWRSQCADTPRCAHFSINFTPFWIRQQISVGKCAHRGARVRQERQTMFQIVTWSKKNMDNLSMPHFFIAVYRIYINRYIPTYRYRKKYGYGNSSGYRTCVPFGRYFASAFILYGSRSIIMEMDPGKKLHLFIGQQ